jgi:signal transduction histidine kinase
MPNDKEPGLHLIAAAGPAVAESPPISVFTATMTTSTQVFSEGSVVVIDDYVDQPGAAQQLVGMGMRSMVVLPVKTSDRTLGIVTVISKKTGHFSPELVQLLTEVSEGLGVLLENSLLHERSEFAYQAQRRMAEESSVLAEIGRIVSSSTDIKEVYETFGEKIRSLVPFDRMSLSFANYENETMSPTWVVGTDVPGLREGDDFPMENSLAGQVVRTKEPYLLEADTEPDLENRFPGLMPIYRAGTNSFMAVPLLSRDVVIGVLRVGSKHKGIYTQQHLELLQRMGDQIAGAVANAQLYAEKMRADQEILDLARFPSENPNPVVRISADGTIMYANDAADRILADRGLKVGDTTLEDWQRWVKEVLATDTPKEVEIVYGTRFMSYSLAPVQEAGYVNIYGRDITKAKEIERLKDDLISNVSHELRTPLTSIKGAVEILLTYQDEDPAMQAEFLGIIDKESDRLARLIENVLDIARFQSGQMQFRLSEVEVPEVIDAAIRSTHSLTIQKDLKVAILLKDDLPKVFSDQDRLVQVVTNLLSNAIKFTPNGGSIQVQSGLSPISNGGSDSAMVEISVSGNGVGIDESELSNIFNRFQQAGDTLSSRPQGSGLGLHISREIVEHLGGKIWVESKPGSGSTFFFTVPVEEASG